MTKDYYILVKRKSRIPGWQKYHRISATCGICQAGVKTKVLMISATPVNNRKMEMNMRLQNLKNERIKIIEQGSVEA